MNYYTQGEFHYILRNILFQIILSIGGRRTKSEIDEQEKLREDIKRSEQKRRDKEKREAERLKFTEKTYSNLNKKSDVHQVNITCDTSSTAFFPTKQQHSRI